MNNRIFSKNIRFSVVLLFCLMMNLNLGFGQEVDKHEIKLLTRATSDSIMLRWGPTTYPLWLHGNKYGYKITRTTLFKDGEYLPNSKAKLLTNEALKPLDLDKWEKLADIDNYAGVAAQAIYGDDFDVEANNESSSMIDIINRASVQESRLGFALFSADQSIKVAKYSGLYYADRDVKKGEKYLYRVFPAFTPPDIQVDTAFFFTGPDEYLPLPSPFNVKAEAGDKMVTVSWNKKYQEEFYNSFWVEKSMNNGKTFFRVNDVPLVNTTPEGYDESDFAFLIDTLVDNQQKYLYRVIGISIFGELSPPSETVEVKGENLISSVPVVHLNKNEEGKAVIVKWDFPNIKGEKIEGFRIFRSDKFAEGYSLLADSISLIQNLYVDTKPLLAGYYRMQAFNSDGSGPYSIPKMIQLVDSIPPAAPLGLKAKADTTGLVKLSWTPNTEADIFGYRVYRANSRREEFSQLTSKAIKQACFNDQINLKTLTKKVFYKIVAVDQRQNQSDFSEIMELERPDIVPPASPFIKTVKSVETGISLIWTRSSSNDVKTQVLYRNISGEKQWEIIKTLAADSSSFIDITVQPKKIYRYLLLAVDRAGNESKATQPVAGKYLGKKPASLWIIPKIKKVKKTKETFLTWDMPDFKVQRYMIYYKNKSGVWRLIDGIPSDQNQYTTKLAGKEFKIFSKV